MRHSVGKGGLATRELGTDVRHWGDGNETYQPANALRFSLEKPYLRFWF